MPQPLSSLFVTCQNEEQTVRFAEYLGELLQPGDIIALNGTLGAGKTRFVRAIAHFFGIDETAVSSPTYLIVQSYPAHICLHHFDLYRIRDEEELYGSGCDEFLDGEGVCLIEWAGRFPGFLPKDHLEIAFEVTGENARQLVLSAFGSKHERLVSGLKKQLSEADFQD